MQTVADDDEDSLELPSPLISDILPDFDDFETVDSQTNNFTQLSDNEDLFLDMIMERKLNHKNDTSSSKNSTRQRNRNRKKNSAMRLAIQSAALEGLQAMVKLYEKTEPDLLASGGFLSPDDPGARLSTFSAPTADNENAMKGGYAALITAKKLKESLNLDYLGIGRQQSPKISLRRTPLEGLCPSRDPPRCLPATLKYRTHDGTCNNAKKSRWGTAQMPFHRFLAPDYSDGVEDIRGSVRGGILPSARFVSLVVHGFQEGVEAPVTMMLAQFGQFIDHDVTSTMQPRSVNGSVPSCCRSTATLHPSCLPIRVPRDDPWLASLGVRCLEFLRSAPAQRRDCLLSWREQTNQATSYLDGSTIYSSNPKTSDKARVFQDGLLQYGRGNPRDDVCLRGALASQCVKPGDTRSGEQPGLLAMHMVWVGEHNRVANELADVNPHWSDEKVYQETRRIVGALVQHITYREFLPLVLGKEVCKLFDLELQPTGYFADYDFRVNPTVANAFAASAFRFGHSLIQSSMMRSDKTHRFLRNNVSLHDENADGDMGGPGSLHRILRGMVNQRASRRDEFITPELTNHLFQASPFPFGMDLAAINIQRGRDHGLPSYTSWRIPCGLSQILDWEDLENIVGPNSANRIQQAYKHVNDIDLFVGGLAERPVVGGLVGPTFACIIAQQFSNLRKGDRFWYENSGFESSFTPAQLQSLRQVTLSQILCRSLEGGTLQPHIFLPPETAGNERLPCGLHALAPIDLEPWLERDPFQIVGNGQIQQPSFDFTSSTERPFLAKPLFTGINNGPKQTNVIDKVDLISNGGSGLHRPSAVSLDTKNKTKVDNKLDISVTNSRPSSNTARPTKIKNKIDAISSVDNKLDLNVATLASVSVAPTISTKKPKTSKRPNNNKLRPTTIINNKLDFSKSNELLTGNQTHAVKTGQQPTTKINDSTNDEGHAETTLTKTNKTMIMNSTKKMTNRRNDVSSSNLNSTTEEVSSEGKSIGDGIDTNGQIEKTRTGETNDKLTARIDVNSDQNTENIKTVNRLTNRPTNITTNSPTVRQNDKIPLSIRKSSNNNRPILYNNNFYKLNSVAPTTLTSNYLPQFSTNKPLRTTTKKPDLQTYMYIETTEKTTPLLNSLYTKRPSNTPHNVVQMVNQLIKLSSIASAHEEVKIKRKTKPLKTNLIGPSSPRSLTTDDVDSYENKLELNSTKTDNITLTDIRQTSISHILESKKIINRRNDENIDEKDLIDKIEKPNTQTVTAKPIALTIFDPKLKTDNDLTNGRSKTEDDKELTNERLRLTNENDATLNKTLRNYGTQEFDNDYDAERQPQYHRWTTTRQPYHQPVRSTSRPYIRRPVVFQNNIPLANPTTSRPLYINHKRTTKRNYYGLSTTSPFNFGNSQSHVSYDSHKVPIVVTSGTYNSYNYEHYEYPTTRKPELQTFMIVDTTQKTTPNYYSYSTKRPKPTSRPQLSYPSSTLASLAASLYYPVKIPATAIKTASYNYNSNLIYPLPTFSNSYPSISHSSAASSSAAFFHAVTSSSSSPYYVSPSSTRSPKPFRNNYIQHSNLKPDHYQTNYDYDNNEKFQTHDFDDGNADDASEFNFDNDGYIRPHYSDYTPLRKNNTRPAYTDYSNYNKKPTDLTHKTKYYYVENVLYKYDPHSELIRQPVKRYADFYDTPLDEFYFNNDEFVNPSLRRTKKTEQTTRKINTLLDFYEHKNENEKERLNGKLDFDSENESTGKVSSKYTPFSDEKEHRTQLTRLRLKPDKTGIDDKLAIPEQRPNLTGKLDIDDYDNTKESTSYELDDAETEDEGYLRDDLFTQLDETNLNHDIDLTRTILRKETVPTHTKNVRLDPQIKNTNEDYKMTNIELKTEQIPDFRQKELKTTGKLQENQQNIDQTKDIFEHEPRTKLTNVFSTGIHRNLKPDKQSTRTIVDDKLDMRTFDAQEKYKHTSHNQDQHSDRLNFEARSFDRQKLIPYQELKVLNSPERPDDWILQHKKKLNFHLPDVPELDSVEINSKEIPRPLFSTKIRLNED